ncbi:MAG: SET domain-containing protein [Chlorobiaceae bacterium]|nr:SET domain-containing protein [Chlorobiaceae bacterium]
METQLFIVIPVMFFCGLIAGIPAGMFFGRKNTDVMNGLVKIGASRVSGRGAFAIRNISEGTIIERCPAIEVTDKDIGGELLNYVFYGKYESSRLVAMGYGMLFNHSPEPNVGYYREETKLGTELVLYALCDIKGGEEMFYNYGEDWWKTR